MSERYEDMLGEMASALLSQMIYLLKEASREVNLKRLTEANACYDSCDRIASLILKLAHLGSIAELEAKVEGIEEYLRND